MSSAVSSTWVRWLLGVDVIPADAGPLRLAFDHDLPPWGWALVLAAAVGVAWWSYRRLDLVRWKRVALGCMRAALLVLLAVLACGPALELPRETREPDVVLVLADRSRSMEVEDVQRTQGGARTSRDAALRQLLAGPDHLLATPGDAHRVQWYGFGDSLVPLAATAQGVDAGPATGQRTLLATAMEQALARAGSRPVSALVLLTDGRTTEPPDPALLRKLRNDGVRVLAVPLGADQALGDTAVTEAQAPRRAFARDLVPVEVAVERRGPALDRPAQVELVDTATGTVLDRAEIAAGGQARQTLQLVARPGAPGDTQWEVRVVDPAGAQDLVPGNDRRTLPVTLVDRPLRVLYVEGYPRWEYRYLKNLLQRESTFESAVMLLSADRNFAQEGNTPITRLPRTREEFERFDLVVIGDIGAGSFTQEQLTELRRLVGERGAGLVWIGGARSTPRSWQGTALEDLLPFTGPLELERVATAVNMRPTPAAQRQGVLRLSDDARQMFPPELEDSGTGWSQLEWAQRIQPSQVKPTAEVLGASVQQVEGANAPLVLSMRYGAGSVLYVATDEIWRWRYGRGETYPERFWLQLLRMMARPTLARGREEVQVAAEPGRATVGDAVRVEVELPSDVQMSTLPLEAVPDTPGVPTAELEARLMPGGRLVGTWTPDAESRWTIKPRDPALAARAGSGAQVQVVRSDRELRDAEADQALLAQLARETGGRTFALDQVDQMAASLPNRSVVSEDPVREPLWNSPLALALVLGLLTAEWAGRRWLRLA